jgi:hypothetical protein
VCATGHPRVFRAQTDPRRFSREVPDLWRVDPTGVTTRPTSGDDSGAGPPIDTNQQHADGKK